MSEDENKSCLWGRQRYINKKKKKKRIVWYHWYWYNNYWKTTYQGNLNCFFLCFVSLHRYTHKHALRIFHYSCSALSGFGSSLLFYTSFPSLDSIDGSATQAHVFISLSKLLLTTRTPPAQKKKKNRALLRCRFSHGKNLAWDLRLSCRVLWQCKTTKNALSVYRVSETLLKWCHERKHWHAPMRVTRRENYSSTSVRWKCWKMQRKRRNKEVCGGYDILKRENETVFEVVVFIFEGESVFGGVTVSSGLGLKFDRKCFWVRERERKNVCGLHVWSGFWSNGGMWNFFVRLCYVACCGWVWCVLNGNGWLGFAQDIRGFDRFEFLEVSHPGCTL